MESQPQNPEFRNDPENFHPCDGYIIQHENICCAAHWKCLGETLPMSSHNIYFLRKNERNSNFNTTLIRPINHLAAQKLF